MKTTAHEVLEFMDENDVKFVRLGFCDLLGVQKNISIMPDELEEAFENGISFDAHAIKGFRDITKSDLLLFPDPSTLTVLPWRPGPGRVIRFYCDIKNPDGSIFLQDSRYLLKQVVARSERMGYICKVGAECEFYLFKTDDDGEPTETTIDKGGYFDIAPLDRGENIRREICICLDEMGIMPEASHHEQGPGQNEIDFKFSDALTCADNLLTFKSVVKAIASRNGLHASFMPKPLIDSAGSGMHVSLSLAENGLNIFKTSENEHSQVAESFIAGILSRVAEITLFLNSNANSYERLGSFEAPKYVSWSHQNRSQLVRIPASYGERSRMELRSPDPSANPYLAFSLIISAGLDGIENNLKLPDPIDLDLNAIDEDTAKSLDTLPNSLDKAIAIAKESTFIKSIIGQEFFEKYISIKEEEASDFAEAKDKAQFYKEQYFLKL